MMEIPRVNFVGPRSEISQQDWSSALNLSVSAAEDEADRMSST